MTTDNEITNLKEAITLHNLDEAISIIEDIYCETIGPLTDHMPKKEMFYFFKETGVTSIEGAIPKDVNQVGIEYYTFMLECFYAKKYDKFLYHDEHAEDSNKIVIDKN